jgi:flagellar L-ring protein precursor FlgH
MKRFLWCLGLAVYLLLPVTSRADSIWQRHNFFSSFLFIDTRARRPGDIVTVVITENTDIEHKDQRNLAKTHEAGGGMTLKGTITGTSQGASRAAASGLAVDVNSNRNFTGNAAYNVNQTFTDTVTCVVVAVQPNGNLLIEGCRQRIVSREMRTLKVSGIVRPFDIAFDNTIPSTFVGNFTIQYVGQGVESKFTNHGWVGQMLNYVWPF